MGHRRYHLIFVVAPIIMRRDISHNIHAPETQVIFGYKEVIQMDKSMFVRVGEVAKDLEVSRSTAYMIIRQLNQELEEKGYLTVAGRVSKKYYIERLYGYDEYIESNRDSSSLPGEVV